MIDYADDEEITLPVPVLTDGCWNGISKEEISTTKDEYFDLITGHLADSEERQISFLQAFQVLGVCPYGFIDEFAAWIVQLESDASTYHVLPSGGGVFDEEQWLMDAFRMVRKARGDYYLWKHAKKGK